MTVRLGHGVTGPARSMAGLVACLALVAGCGDDGEPDGAGPDPSSEATGTPSGSSPGATTGSDPSPAPLPPGATGWTVRDATGCGDLGELEGSRLMVRVPVLTADCLVFPAEGQQLVLAGERSELPAVGDPVTVPGVDARIVAATPPEMSSGQAYVVEPAGGSAYLVPWNGGTGGSLEDLVAALFAS